MRCTSILIVEDDKSIQESLCEALRSEGYDVDVADNGSDALQVIKTRSKPCLILLDIMMPVMGGVEFLQKIHSLSMKGVVHFIIITALAKPDEYGHRFLHKPFSLTELFNTVDEICIKTERASIA